MFNGLHEECGIVAIFNAPEAAKLAYLGLYALQHRGQESAGIVSSNGTQLFSHRARGLVADAFNRKVLDNLPGDHAIGHVRYSTTGSSRIQNAQPLTVNYHGGAMAMAHNGNLTNADEMRVALEKRGAIFQTTTDSELFLHLIAHSSSSEFSEALMLSLMRVKGAYSAVMLRPDRLVAFRDPNGIRPLCLGRLNEGWVIASETCALDIMDAEYEREILPGEIVTITDDGFQSQSPYAPHEHAYCVFENIYFSRPDSMTADGRSVYDVRVGLGEELWREHPVEADVVIGIPDSANAAAIGCAQAAGLPFQMGLIRNHYVGRTFIEPEQHIRDFGAKIKYNPVRSVLEGKRVIAVDDSIVRGTTSRKIVKMLRRAGAKEVHVRSSAPPIGHPCFYGVDMPSYEELIASQMSVEEINKQIGSDSLGYVSIEGMLRVMPNYTNYCCACFDGEYAVGKPEAFNKIILEN